VGIDQCRVQTLHRGSGGDLGCIGEGRERVGDALWRSVARRELEIRADCAGTGGQTARAPILVAVSLVSSTIHRLFDWPVGSGVIPVGLVFAVAPVSRIESVGGRIDAVGELFEGDAEGDRVETGVAVDRVAA